MVTIEENILGSESDEMLGTYRVLVDGVQVGTLRQGRDGWEFRPALKYPLYF